MSRARDLADGTFSGAFAADSPTFVVDAANNNVGIGVSSPNTKLHITGNLTIENGVSNAPFIDFVEAGDNTDVKARIQMDQVSGTAGQLLFYTEGGGTLSERLRLDSSGNLLVGTTVHYSSSYRMSVAPATGTGGIIFKNFAGTNSGAPYAFLNTSDALVGFIGTNSTSTTYNTSSDYRLKENVVPLAGAADRLAQIPVHRFNFIADPDRTVDGFLAHEVQEFVPECVTGQKDQVETVEVTDEDGNVTTETRPVYQGIDQSKLVPLLTAALQEALADIATLKAEVAALKGSA